jgi:hypothetical protein
MTKSLSNETNKQVIQRLKLNYGLYKDGCKPSKQAIFTDDGELSISLYDSQPIIYININELTSTSLFNFNLDNGSFSNKLQPSDVCINFPIAKITYKGEFLENFLKCTGNEENLHELYGHDFARKVSVGSKLFIKEFNSATQAQIDILKFYLFCAYNLAKYSIEVQFNNLFPLNLLSRIETLDGEELNTYEKLVKWMSNLYPKKTLYGKEPNSHEGLLNWINNLFQMKKIDVISYDSFVPTSRLRYTISSIYDHETFDERQPGIINFKERLSIEDWVGDAAYNNLASWSIDFHLFQGLIFKQNREIEISKKIAMNFIEVPKINISDKSCLDVIRPSTRLEVKLISNNILSVKDLNSFPFIENDVEGYKDYSYILVRCEQYEILLNKNDIKPTKELERAIEEALNSMKPLKVLQDVFNEFGHLLPLRIILGSSFKSILPNSSSHRFDNINLKSLIFDTNDNLEVIEFDNIIPLYKILKEQQQSKIDNILKGNYKILMTGITELRDLNNNVENYKRINIEPSLEDENYEVYGTIISEDNLKLEEIYVNFGLNDYNGFFAIIKKLESANIDVTKCYILWVIIGIPSKSSVFSPKNRKVQVNCIKKSIILQPDQSSYRIETPFLLYKGDAISVHAYYPLTNFEPNCVIKLAKWKDRFIDVQITDIVSMPEKAICIELHICVLHSDYGKLKIDNKEELEYPLDLTGYFLTDKNTDAD